LLGEREKLRRHLRWLDAAIDWLSDLATEIEGRVELDR